MTTPTLDSNIPIRRASGNIIERKYLEELRKKNKAVAMVGFSARHRHLTPFDDPNIEIWGLNRLHQQKWFTRTNRMFQLHPIKYLQKCVGLSAGDRDHYEWLTQKHDFPIYCQKAYSEFPSAVKYPIWNMRRKYGDFYTSTLAYMMAMALDEGFNHIELYGYDMEADTEYKYQRDSAEYFIGLAEGMGVEVFLPSNSSLIKGGLGMYAYETTEVGYRQLLEGRIIQLQNQKDNAGTEYNHILAQELLLEDLVKTYPELQEELDKVREEKPMRAGKINVITGAQEEVHECVKLFDAHYNALGVEIESGGEDGTPKE